MFSFEIRKISCEITCADPERGRGSGPPGKSHVIWVSIEISIWTPPPPEKVGPPPPLKKLDPSETLENNSFL